VNFIVGFSILAIVGESNLSPLQLTSCVGPKHVSADRYATANVRSCVLKCDLPPVAFFTVHDFPIERTPLVDTETVVGKEDQSAIRRVIESQIDALRAGDFVKAFSFASPAIQKELGSPQGFVDMVKTSYEQVIGPRSIVFEDLKQVMGIVTQPVLLFAQDGDLIIASYVMEKEENGDWKISGCYLAPVK
jgi:hypothetical protein